MPFTLVTWNINSLRSRKELVKQLMTEEAPDIICLQECKSPVEKLPLDEFADHGWPHFVGRGQKGYNGVGILSRLPLKDAGHHDWCGKGDARHVVAEMEDGTRIQNFYVPAGGDMPDRDRNDKFGHKLDFLTEMRERFHADPPKRQILVGDLNIAPGEEDVWNHRQLLRVVSHTPVETEHFGAVQAAGKWVDIVRRDIPGGKLYSWWSYRAKDWSATDKGRRLDHIWVTPDIADAAHSPRVLRHIRGWEKASDHAPVIAGFNL